MRSDFTYDPVPAIDELAAVGDTALVFAEIRRTMDIPLITSIWCGLAGMDDSLRPVLGRLEAYLRERRTRAGARTQHRSGPHWPALLALIHCAFAPLQSRGLLDEANAQLVALSDTEGARMAYLRPTLPALSPQALAAITGYVRSPTQAARMVAIGHVLTSWLAR